MQTLTFFAVKLGKIPFKHISTQVELSKSKEVAH
jgi:hypothetical protein